MNCFIYINDENLESAIVYLYVRNVPFKVNGYTKSAKIEIASYEKYSRILDNCAKRFGK